MDKRSELLEEIFALMAVSKRVMHAPFQSALAKLNLSPSQMHVLDILARHGAMSFKDLAAEMYLTPGAITQMVDGLVQAGYIERKQDAQDRRVTNLSTSTSAKQVLSRFKKIREQILAQALESLDERELEIYLQIQRKMLAYFEDQQAQCKQNKERQHA